ncbi:MAG TPA: energy-coupling factor transporter ATPase [Firmicutes bacterium]|nr:energy-coupling factor transporter ATPase [Bacillota bacterium]
MPIEFRDLSFTYNLKSPLQSPALKGIDLLLEDHAFIAIVGRTGSGKSTLIQMINALLSPTSGYVDVNGFINHPAKKEKMPKRLTAAEKAKFKAEQKRIYQKHTSKDIKALRKKVGLVFQFPEYQLFEDSVEKDVSFGPKNFGMKKEEALKVAHEALLRVGLDESFFQRSPFELSGGEKRKVAIAGILATSPDILVVDEPTAGLDPAAAKETMTLFKKIEENGTGIILVTHDMDLVASYGEKVVVMENGEVEKVCTPSELFGQDLTRYSLQNPHIFDFALRLEKKGLDIDTSNMRNVDDLANAIIRSKKNG